MQKCRDCNSTLRTGELKCYHCGAATQAQETLQSVIGKRFLLFMNVAFVLSALLTVASLFFDFTPPFGGCITVTFVLLMIRSSAGQMMEKNKG